MATLYWVGGTASWDATAGTKWATASGGAGGSGPPTAADDVRFDASSTGTCTVTSTSVCRSLDTTGHTGTLSWGNSATAVLKVGDASGGALTIGTGTTIGSFTGAVDALQLVSSSSNGGAGWPITTNGKTLPPTTFGGTAAVTGGKWVLQDALTVTASGSGLLRLNGGELDTNSKTVTLNWKFNATGSAVRTLTLGSSTITVAGTGTAWDITTGTNLTITANTASVTVSAAGAGFVGGSKNYNGMSLAFSGSGTHAITGANTFASLTSAPGSTLTLPASATTTITGSFASGAAGNLVTVTSSVSGTAATLSRASGTVSSDYLSLKDNTATGGAAFFAGAHSTNVSGNTGWTFTAPTWTGTSAQTLPSFTQAATGTRTLPVFTGAAAQTLPSFTQVATGTRTVPTVTGSGTQTVPAFTQAATGTVTAPVFSGTAASILAAFTQTAAGTRTLPVSTGSAASVLPTFTQQANGTVTAPAFTGLVVTVLPAFTQTATGTAAAALVIVRGTGTTTVTARTVGASAVTRHVTGTSTVTSKTRGEVSVS